MTRKFGTRVRFKVEDFGASPLAERFGIDKYPAIFVDDALVSRPEDFYEWGGAKVGRYVPWSDVANRRKFQGDLQRMLDIRLAGGDVPSLKPIHSSSAGRALPAVKLTDLDGATLKFADFRGKPLLIEFWATWCPICIDTLQWMKKMDPKSANVVAVVIDSERKDIDRVMKALQPRARVVMGSPAIREAFGGPPAVPTLILADAKGKIVRIFYGAPPNLHDEIARELKKLGGP